MSVYLCWNCGGYTESSMLGRWCRQCDVMSLEFSSYDLNWFEARRQQTGMEWQEKTATGAVTSVWVDFIDHSAEYAPTP